VGVEGVEPSQSFELRLTCLTPFHSEVHPPFDACRHTPVVQGSAASLTALIVSNNQAQASLNIFKELVGVERVELPPLTGCGFTDRGG
jgi:hypothetical protein